MVGKNNLFYENPLNKCLNQHGLRGGIMNPKAKGSRNERRSMEIVEKAGYHCTRSAGSLGLWDFIGVGKTDFVLVQCKTRDWPGTIEMAELREFSCPPNTKKLIHRWVDYRRLPDVKEI